MQSTITKQVSARRSFVLSLPSVVFPVFSYLNVAIFQVFYLLGPVLWNFLQRHLWGRIPSLAFEYYTSVVINEFGGRMIISQLYLVCYTKWLTSTHCLSQSFILMNHTKYCVIPQPKMICTRHFLLRRIWKMFCTWWNINASFMPFIRNLQLVIGWNVVGRLTEKICESCEQRH